MIKLSCPLLHANLLTHKGKQHAVQLILCTIIIVITQAHRLNQVPARCIQAQSTVPRQSYDAICATSRLHDQSQLPTCAIQLAERSS